MPKRLLLLALIALVLLPGAARAQRIEVKAEDYTSTTYMTPAEIAVVKRTHALNGYGKADYNFTVPKDGWCDQLTWVSSTTPLPIGAKIETPGPPRPAFGPV